MHREKMDNTSLQEKTLMPMKSNEEKETNNTELVHQEAPTSSGDKKLVLPKIPDENHGQKENRNTLSSEPRKDFKRVSRFVKLGTERVLLDDLIKTKNPVPPADKRYARFARFIAPGLMRDPADYGVGIPNLKETIRTQYHRRERCFLETGLEKKEVELQKEARKPSPKTKSYRKVEFNPHVGAENIGVKHLIYKDAASSNEGLKKSTFKKESLFDRKTSSERLKQEKQYEEARAYMKERQLIKDKGKMMLINEKKKDLEDLENYPSPWGMPKSVVHQRAAKFHVMRGWRYKDDPDYDLFGKKKAVGKPKDSSTSKSEEMLLEEEKERNSYRLKILDKQRKEEEIRRKNEHEELTSVPSKFMWGKNNTVERNLSGKLKPHVRELNYPDFGFIDGNSADGHVGTVAKIGQEHSPGPLKITLKDNKGNVTVGRKRRWSQSDAHKVRPTQTPSELCYEEAIWRKKLRGYKCTQTGKYSRVKQRKPLRSDRRPTIQEIQFMRNYDQQMWGKPRAGSSHHTNTILLYSQPACMK